MSGGHRALERGQFHNIFFAYICAFFLDIKYLGVLGLI